jgi:uracil-DNA glycosylase family protein
VDRAAYPGAQAWVPSKPTLPRLRSALADCRGCDLYEAATQAVMGEGPSDARLMLVGEQPGDREDEAGRPFVGPAGRLLDRALVDAGLDPSSAYRTNVVKHFRFVRKGGKRLHKGPSRWHVASCEPWLLAELEAVGPSVVVLLGATASQAVYGPGFRVGQGRGRRLEWPHDSVPAPDGAPGPDAVVVTVHPSAVLRSRQRDVDLAALVQDLRVAAQLLAQSGSDLT